MIIIFQFSRPFEAGFDHQERRPVESLEEGHCAYGHVCQLILGRSRFKDAETGCLSLLLFDLCDDRCLSFTHGGCRGRSNASDHCMRP